MARERRSKLERVAKRIARSGYCSRRDAERLIATGRVAVDGEVWRARPWVTDTSRITAYHKPAGVLTAARDPEGRTIYDRLPETCRG